MKRRLPAEWESQALVQFTFPHEQTDWRENLIQVIPCFVEAIWAISRFQPVLIVCTDEEKARTFLKECNQPNLVFKEIPSNDTWARDHGGITIFDEDKVIVLDFQFNGWGEKYDYKLDNAITGKLEAKSFFTAEVQKVDLVLEGGSIESDGLGTLLTTSSCLLHPKRNPHLSQEQIEEQLKHLFGIRRILWLNHGLLEGDDTDGHIDTLARFCDSETIAYVQTEDKQDSHYQELKKMEEELKTFVNVDGQPYKLVPLPLPSPIFSEFGDRLPATYANFLITNDAVLLPVYQVKEDAVAAQILQKCFPNREIIPINCRPIIEQGGSLHCLTMQYPIGVI